MAKIAIDARLFGVKDTGIGRYTENLVENLLKIDHRHQFFLLARSKDAQNLKTRFPLAQVITSEIPIYSLKEQLRLPIILAKIKPDLYHAPHFNIPILWPGRMVVTIHDLITHEFRGSAQTTLPLPIYWLKYLVHLVVFRLAVFRAVILLVPSNWVKDRLIKVYRTKQQIAVTPEAAGDIFSAENRNRVAARPYLIYSGNAYEHKNLDRLISAVQKCDTPLILVSAKSVFRDRLEQKINQTNLKKLIKIIGPVDDRELTRLYRESLAFITPSLSEGFGLSGLEAMSAGTVILSSNASCLPEVYGDVPIYFNPLNIQEIVGAIKKVIKMNNSERDARIKKGILYSRRYTWDETARLTLKAYDQALKDKE